MGLTQTYSEVSCAQRVHSALTLATALKTDGDTLLGTRGTGEDRERVF